MGATLNQESCSFASRAGSARDLPFLPPSLEIVPRILVLLKDPEVDGECLADLIRVDPGLTADILRISNSAFYGGMVRAETLPQAITRLGLREITRVVAMVVYSPILAQAEQYGIRMMDLWRHSLASAVSAQLLFESTGNDSEIAFTAGLLHDIGQAVLAQNVGTEYVTLFQRCRKEKSAFWKLERELLKRNHALEGAQLLKNWNFPANIVEAIEWHHEPLKAPEQNRMLAISTHLGDRMAHRILQGHGVAGSHAEAEEVCVRQLGISSTDFEELLTQASDKFEQERNRFPA